jgi:glycosyltransferase involved in cell wall biosynthesis
VLTFHTGGHSSNWRNAIRAGQWRVLRPLLAGARKLIAVSAFEARTFRTALALPPDRFAVIPNGSNLTKSLDDSPHQSALSPSTIDDAPLILSVGRLERYKGHQQAVAALPHVRAVYPGARLLILGTGSYERALRDQVQTLGLADAVEIRSIPPGSREMMAATVAKAAVVVLLSEYESQGIAVMEALSLGRPVVVADTTALHDLAEQALARAVSITSTPKQVAEAILSQLRQPLIPDRLALPTWEQCATDLLAVYEEAATVAC